MTEKQTEIVRGQLGKYPALSQRHELRNNSAGYYLQVDVRLFTCWGGHFPGVKHKYQVLQSVGEDINTTSRIKFKYMNEIKISQVNI